MVALFFFFSFFFFLYYTIETERMRGRKGWRKESVAEDPVDGDASRTGFSLQDTLLTLDSHTLHNKPILCVFVCIHECYT